MTPRVTRKKGDKGRLFIEVGWSTNAMECVMGAGVGGEGGHSGPNQGVRPKLRNLQANVSY